MYVSLIYTKIEKTLNPLHLRVLYTERVIYTVYYTVYYNEEHWKNGNIVYSVTVMLGFILCIYVRTCNVFSATCLF